MVLSREKRSNAGRAPQRLDDANVDTLPPSTQSTGPRRVILKVKEASVASQGSKRSSKKSTPAPASRNRAVSVQPASLRRQEDVSTASPSPEPSLSESCPPSAQKDAQEEQEQQEQQEEQEEEEVEETVPLKSNTEYSSYTLELSVMLGKRGVYNTSIRSERFYFEGFEEEARRRASEAALLLYYRYKLY
jgi:hypothetical protein